jgi:hypothetical protein
MEEELGRLKEKLSRERQTERAVIKLRQVPLLWGCNPV